MSDILKGKVEKRQPFGEGKLIEKLYHFPSEIINTDAGTNSAVTNIPSYKTVAYKTLTVAIWIANLMEVETVSVTEGEEKDLIYIPTRPPTAAGPPW